MIEYKLTYMYMYLAFSRLFSFTKHRPMPNLTAPVWQSKFENQHRHGEYEVGKPIPSLQAMVHVFISSFLWSFISTCVSLAKMQMTFTGRYCGQVTIYTHVYVRTRLSMFTCTCINTYILRLSFIFYVFNSIAAEYMYLLLVSYGWHWNNIDLCVCVYVCVYM